MDKRVSESITEQVHIITQSDLNGYKRLFGGQLMEWVDIVAAVTARRHCEMNVTTAMIDTLEFRQPAHANDLIVLIGQMTYVGSSSMEVCVRSYVENLNGLRRLINKAYFVMVALDKNEEPAKVPGLILETDYEKEEWEAGKKRYEIRRNRRKGIYDLCFNDRRI